MPAKMTLGILATCLWIGGTAGVAQAQTAGPDDFAHFAYDKSAPLNVKQVSVKVRGSVTIQDITYMGANGDTVPAYLVIPNGTGKFAGIIWGHWMMPGVANANRSEFLDEAVALAPAGVISLLIDAPQSRPDFKIAPGGFFGPQGPALIGQQVVDLRRGLDLLLSRPDIDARRIAYVGHSFDAQVGPILDAVDKRFAAFVFMSGPQSTREYVLSSDSPLMAPVRQKMGAAKLEQILKANAWSDPWSYASKLGPAPALFQYGRHDEDWVPLADAKHYVARASGPKTVQYYDADHALNDKARADRDGFLKKVLNLKP